MVILGDIMSKETLKVHIAEWLTEGLKDFIKEQKVTPDNFNQIKIWLKDYIVYMIKEK